MCNQLCIINAKKKKNIYIYISFFLSDRTNFYPSNLPITILSTQILVYLKVQDLLDFIDGSNPCPWSTICVNNVPTPKSTKNLLHNFGLYLLSFTKEWAPWRVEPTLLWKRESTVPDYAITAQIQQAFPGLDKTNFSCHESSNIFPI